MTNSTIALLACLSGLLLSLNPTILSVFIALLLGSAGKGHKKSERNVIVFTFLFVLLCLFLLVGLITINLFSFVSATTQYVVSMGIAIIAIIWGVASIKEYYWYGSHRHVAIRLAQSIHKRTMKKNDVASAALLSITTAYATVPSVGIPLVTIAAIIALLPTNQLSSIFVFVGMLLVPLLIIYIAYINKFKLSTVLKWKEDSKGTFRLVIGLTSIFLAWILLLLINGVIQI